jgi:putative membrane protein
MLNFILYFVVSICLLTAFMISYERLTPYRELQEIRAGNVAAAISFMGATLGFTFPLIATVFYTHSILEMLKWAVITGVVQMLVFLVLQKVQDMGTQVHKGNVASGIMLGGLSIVMGMINAICISY